MSLSAVQAFYDQYHRKNDRYQKLIRPGNFTYYYHFQLLQLAGVTSLTGLRVLDVGCGVGTLSLYAAAQGASVQGIDISPRAVSLAQAAAEALQLQNARFAVGEVGAGKGEYDLVLCSEVIEHVPDELQFLRHLVSQLKPGGRLILTTPSSQNLLYRLGYYRRFDAEVGHLRRYTAASLRQRLSAAGLEIILLRGVEGPLRNLLFTSPLGVLIRFLKGPLVPLFHWLDELGARLCGPADWQVVATRVWPGEGRPRRRRNPH